jgi:hypothetical protein
MPLGLSPIESEQLESYWCERRVQRTYTALSPEYFPRHRERSWSRDLPEATQDILVPYYRTHMDNSDSQQYHLC